MKNLMFIGVAGAIVFFGTIIIILIVDKIKNVTKKHSVQYNNIIEPTSAEERRQAELYDAMFRDNE